jgi:hypothetical protein
VRTYFLDVGGRLYDSKAIAGVAHGSGTQYVPVLYEVSDHQETHPGGEGACILVATVQVERARAVSEKEKLHD